MGIDGGYLAKLQNVPQITPENFTGEAPHSGCIFTQSVENFKSSCSTYTITSQNDVFEIEISNLNSVSNQVGSLQTTRSAFSAILANQGLNLSRLSFDINNLKEQTDILVTKTKPVLRRSAQKARAAVAAITEEAADAPSTSPAPGAP